MTEYAVFRKAFHVPHKWLSHVGFQELVNHRYVTENAGAALKLIQETLKDMGYDNDNSHMIHDYLHFMLMDLLDKNGEVYLTEDDIRSSPTVLELFNGSTPDLVVKSGNERARPLIVDIYAGNKDSVKQKYKAFGYFADLCIMTQTNFPAKLKEHRLLKDADVDYLYRHFQIFLVEHQYWQACIKLRRVIVNEIENARIEAIPPRTPHQEDEAERFKTSLSHYAHSVVTRKGL